jgi:hypothetical protein
MSGRGLASCPCVTRRGVTLVCSSGYAAMDTWNTRKLRTAQLGLSLLRLTPKKKPLCVRCDIDFACKIAFLNTHSSKVQEKLYMAKQILV